MKYAVSMRYGGELVEAADCDYSNYLDLGLLCPNCKEPLFLQRSSSRLTQDRVITISSHFKHFATKNLLLARLCESRVAKYDQQDLERRAKMAQNQRLKILQTRFLNMINFSYLVTSLNLSEYCRKDLENAFLEHVIVLGITKKTAIESAHHFLEKAVGRFREGKNRYKQMLKAHFQRLISGDNYIAVDLITDEAKQAYRKYVSKIDLQMQEVFCQEVIDFLASARSIPILEKLTVAASFQSQHFPRSAYKSAEDTWELTCQKICVLIESTNWAEQFSNFNLTPK